MKTITSCMLPVATTMQPIDLSPGIRLTCQQVAADKPQSALAELSLETDRGPVQLLCGGRFLNCSGAYYTVDQNRQASATLTARLWRGLAA